MAPVAGGEDDADIRRSLKELLDADIKQCRRCDGLNQENTRSAPGHGSIYSPVVLVGQSLCAKCMHSGVPFTGGSGVLIERGLGSARKDRAQVFITNAVHCHPPGDRKSHNHEIINCSPFLHRELAIVRPRLVITLGEDAERVVSFIYPNARHIKRPFVSPAGRLSQTTPCLFPLKHPSWIRRKHDPSAEAQYIRDLGAAISWAFDAHSTVPPVGVDSGQRPQA